MEERAIEEEQVGKARDKVRAQLAKVQKLNESIESGEDLSDVPPHMLGR